MLPGNLVKAQGFWLTLAVSWCFEPGFMVKLLSRACSACGSRGFGFEEVQGIIGKST